MQSLPLGAFVGMFVSTSMREKVRHHLPPLFDTVVEEVDPVGCDAVAVAVAVDGDVSEW